MRLHARLKPLDGLRGVAVLAVLAYHVAPGAFPGGFLGVDMFFVLSGFLLTSLLLEEHATTGAVDHRGYAVRRARRIAPALLVLLAAMVVVVPLAAASNAYRLRGDVVSSLVGGTNWHLIGDGSSYFVRVGGPSVVRHLWSIAVEIQFYVLCPFLVAWLARRRPWVAATALAAGILTSATLMGLLYRSPDPSRAYFGTDSRVHALLAGCLLAVVLARSWAAGVARRRRETEVLGLVSLAVLVAMVFVGGERSRAAYPAAFLVAEAATAALIVAALRPGPTAGLLGRPELRWLGIRSYGIYLWSWPLVVLLGVADRSGWSALAVGTATIAGAVLLGALSWRYVERPFLHPRSSPRDRRVVAGRAALATVAAVVVATALVRIPTTNHLAVVLHAGEKALAAQPPPTVSATTTTTTTTTATTLPPAPAPAPTDAVPAEPAVQPVAAPPPEPVLPSFTPGSQSVTGVGDSVMVGGANELLNRLGPSGYIDARQNRYFDEAIPIVDHLQAQGALGRVVVVHLGNNGPVSSDDVDNLMRHLPGAQNVLLVTLRVDAEWQDDANAFFRDAARRWPSVRIVDWYSFSAGHGDWFQADGTHFTSDSGPGASAYADLIAGSIPPPPTTTSLGNPVRP